MKKRAVKVSSKDFSKYIFWATIAVLVLVSYFIIRSFIIPLISAFVLAYLCKPVYDKLVKNKFPKPFSAILCLILITIIIILPFSAILGGIANQTSSLLNRSTISEISSLPILKNIDLETLTDQLSSLIISLASTALTYIPSIVISLLIILFGVYYMLINWETLSTNLKKYLPFKDKDKVSKEISQLTNSLIYGTIFIAAIEFVLAILGFWISGVNAFLLLPALIFFLAFIPGLGPTIVWVPMAIYYLIVKDYSTMIGVIITGLVLSSFIDTIFRSKILGKRTNLNPFIMLIGILGGIAVFGIFGFIVGPIILIYTMKLLEEALQHA